MGLAAALAVCLLIFLFVYNEISYDRFHEKAEQIYRANLRFNMGSNEFDTAHSPVPLGPALFDEYPEVKTSVRLYNLSYRNIDVFVKYQDKQFKEMGFLWADSTIFDVFTLHLLEGNPADALRRPNSVLLTPGTAEKYFGAEDPMGKMLTLHDGSLYSVTGIVEEMSSNSQFSFDFLASFSSLAKSRDPEWYDTAVHTYIVLQDDFDWKVLDAKLPELSKKYVAPVIERAMGMEYEQFIKAGNYFGFFIEPMLDIHLYSNTGSSLAAPGNINTVLIFAAIAILILLTACINFINLATARSSLRANEVGVRKAAGALRRQLIVQFLVESIIYSLLSLGIAFIIMEVSLPFMNNLLGLKLNSGILLSWTAFPILLLLTLILGILAGIYPAFVLSAFKPVEVLKGRSQSSSKGQKFRSTLAVFQFAVSIVLIAGTIVIYNQLQYLQSKNLGFNKEQVIVIPNASKLAAQQKTFKDKLKQYPGIINSTYTDCVPQMMLEVKPFQKTGDESSANHTLITIMTDPDFMDTYQIQMSAGRFFDRAYSTDSSAVLLNQAAVKSLNFAKPLERQLTWLGRRKRNMQVIGIIKDFHTESMHQNIRPMASMLMRGRPGEFLSVRVKPENISETIAFIEEQWRLFVPQQPLEYVFFDDQFGAAYQSEIQAGSLFTIFASLAVLIACLGLFALASFSVLNRTKEIGIRKVLGSSSPGLFILLAKDFTKWVIIANIIAWPSAWLAMNSWLQGFAYKTEMSWWIFVLAGFTALIIAISTVSVQAGKAATANPIKALRYE